MIDCPDECSWNKLSVKPFGRRSVWVYCPVHDMFSFEDLGGGWSVKRATLGKMAIWAAKQHLQKCGDSQ